MRRREFITVVGGAAVAWPLAARAQQGERMRRVGVLTAMSETDPTLLPRMAAFQKSLQAFGWAEGRNVSIVYRHATSDVDRFKSAALERVATDVIKPDLKGRTALGTCGTTRPAISASPNRRSGYVRLVAV
jgi:putative ABC transport system substrate-binding protein